MQFLKSMKKRSHPASCGTEAYSVIVFDVQSVTVICTARIASSAVL